MLTSIDYCQIEENSNIGVTIMVNAFLRCYDCDKIYNIVNIICPNCYKKYIELYKKDCNDMKKNYEKNNNLL